MAARDDPFDPKLDTSAASEPDARLHLKALDDTILVLLARRMARALLLDQDDVTEAVSGKRPPPA